MAALRYLRALSALCIALLSQGCTIIWDTGGERHAAGTGYVSWPLPTALGRTPVAGLGSIGVTFLATAATTGLVIGAVRERAITTAVDQPPAGDVRGSTVLTWDAEGMRNAIVIGHISWPISSNDQPILASGVDVLGTAVLGSVTGFELSIGYGRSRTIILSGDRHIRMDCIQCDLSKARATTSINKE